MRKRNRRPRPEPEQPLSADRIKFIEEAFERGRARKRRHITALAVAALVLAAIIFVATGLASETVAAAKDLADSAMIALAADAGWPQNTGLDEVTQVQTLSGGFVALGTDSCVVYSASGNRLNAIQSGYARPALAAGRTRFVLYNRSGNELRVESRTQNLYTKTTENSIYLCAVADDGQVAVVTDAVRSVAELTVYSSSMEQQLTWEMTGSEGVPLRMAFSPDSRRLAVAAVTASGGQMTTNLYVLPVSQGEPTLVGTQNGTPTYVEWLSSSALLVVYDNRAVVYNATGGERSMWDFSGRSLIGASVDADSGAALLFESGQMCEAAVLDRDLNVQFCGSVPSAHGITRAGDKFYLLTEGGVLCFDSAGNSQWSQELSVRPQALLAYKNQLFVFCGNTVQTLEEPASEAE